ncbi:hypothetical protein AAFF_G00278960 [Aldrovandia affinis]|uniref:Uncharacterized protein n=1 Tax=Aldrovandia affinis TaxID=143900 RepID=A0AAD7WS75_9TELE|nr:hypothetical protein AAFF_G00278960 [Aldrovandia affinis]
MVPNKYEKKSFKSRTNKTKVGSIGSTQPVTESPKMAAIDCHYRLRDDLPRTARPDEPLERAAFPRRRRDLQSAVGRLTALVALRESQVPPPAAFSPAEHHLTEV